MDKNQTANILAIDDEFLVCRALDVHLRMAGFYNVEYQTDSTTALEKIIEFKPDLVLLDIMMPNLGGLELLCEIMKLENPPRVVMLSAADMASKYDALELGAYDFINKPIDSKELIVRVKHALND